MTSQLQGEVLFKGIDSTAGQWVYSPWIEVRGDIATYAIEVIAITAGITLSWQAETRTEEDPATVTDVLSAVQTTTAVGIDDSTPTKNAKQWIRYKFATGSGGDITKWVRCRALTPSWQLNR